MKGNYIGKTKKTSLFLIFSFALMVAFCGMIYPAAKPKERVLLLMYSALSGKRSQNAVYYGDFKAQMKVLKDNGFVSIRLNDLLDFYYNNKALPEKSFLITFDDGVRKSFKYAHPILRRMNLNAVMFVIPSKMDTGDHYFVSWHDMEFMLKSKRWEIGTHTDNGHEYIPIDAKGNKGLYLVNKMWVKEKNRLETDREFEERIRKDYKESKEKIQNRLKGFEVYAVSVPQGDLEEWLSAKDEIKVNKKVIKENFKLCFFQYNTSFADKNSDPFMLQRLIVKPEWSYKVFASLAGIDLPGLDYFVDTFTGSRLKEEWLLTSGEAYYRGKKLIFSPVKKRKDAQAWILGTNLFDKWITEIDFELKGEDSQFWVYARYADKENHIRVGFDEKNFYFQKIVGGKTTESFKKTVSRISGPLTHFRIIEKPDGIIAYAGKERIGRISVDSALKKGLIGIEVWKADIASDSRVIISRICVKSLSNIWALVSPKSDEEIKKYTALLEASSFLSPKGVSVSEEGLVAYEDKEFDFFRMLASYYGMKLIPMVKITQLESQNIDAIIEKVSRLAEDKGTDGINIDITSLKDFKEDKLADFLDKLHRKLSEKRKYLTVTFSFSNEHRSFLENTIPKVSDWNISRTDFAKDVLQKLRKPDPKFIPLKAYDDEVVEKALTPKARPLAVSEE